MSLLTPTAHRVDANTSSEVNRKIHQQTQARVELERCLETGATSLTLLDSALGATVNRKWFLLPAGVAAFQRAKLKALLGR